MLGARLVVEPRSARRPEDFRADALLENVGHSAVEIDPASLSSPSLALEIESQGGEPVLLPPPPVPGAREPAVSLKPAESFEVSFASFLPAGVERGGYRARLRYRAGREPVVSDWVDFVLD